MRIFLPLLWVLCAAPVRGVFDGACPRKDPPPGVLVLSPGSKLILTCSGHVDVDGVKVRDGLNTNRYGSSTDATPTTTVNIRSNTGVSLKSDKHTVGNTLSEGYHSNPTEATENRSLGLTDTGYTVSPTTYTVQPTSVSRLRKRESQNMDEEGDYEEGEEDEEEGSRVTRGIKSRIQWKWNGRTVGKGDRDWGEITFERRGASLSLSSVRLMDSGRYTCYHRGRERFSLKVTVSDHPETPSLSCYKRSPSSKIRCEWTPQKPVAVIPTCYLLLSKSPSEPFFRITCSYSSRLSRCWCALDYHEDEMRTLHLAFLCVTSITGNATSNLLQFTPLDILKPNPPSDVSVRQEEGHETKLTATWSLPISWKSQDSYYALTYEIKYRPLKSSFYQNQVQGIKIQRSYTITDALSGVEYLIQVRAKDEYDGQWSEWSAPVYASSWTAKATVDYDDLAPTVFPVYREGSGFSDDYATDVPGPVYSEVAVSHHVIWWISGSFFVLLVILAAYIFRHKDRFMSKLQSLSVITQCSDSPQPSPSAPTPPESQSLVTFAPRCYKKPPPSEEKEEEAENEKEEEEENEEEDQQVNERIEATHFSNTSYFFLRSEC
ncbi:interleukin-6 receptor subunit alpha [Plectropomus leopardus]|uniref:interleukin-6 receptor subunit alpha n=1 Tax=Plectropomus leopardus TaxID=160734 RepID=UPI001C4D2A50|nr:interleukin-6 receptor subunit alpha [Plectropomus leopardus]